MSKTKLNETKWSIRLLIILCAIRVCKSTCSLPISWSGVWLNQREQELAQQQTYDSSSTFFSSSSSSTGSVSQIDDTRFLNKGICINNKDERYFFYDRTEKCFRCLFIIQRHFNILQYRETHCDEEMTNFEELCDLLSPDLPLLTMIRDEAIAEKCTLGDSYQVVKSLKATSDLNLNKINNNNKCIKQPESNIITKCSDNTMLRLDFQDCLNQPNSLSSSSSNNNNNKFDWINPNNNNNSQIKKQKPLNENVGLVAYCIAHWSEGNWNYLIVKQQHKNEINRSIKTNQQTNYKCIVYKDLDRPFKNTNGNSILNPTNNLIQLTLSDDDLCRDFYANSDGLNSFTLEKIDKHKNANIKHKHRKHGDSLLSLFSSETTSTTTTTSCRFPKFLNKKWKNLRQTKYVFNLNANTLQIVDSNNHSSHSASSTYVHDDHVYLKLSCIQSIKSHKHISKLNANNKKRNEFVYLVNNHLECSSNYKCLSVLHKSEFILNIKYSNFDGKNCLFDQKNTIYEDHLFIETDYGIDCPFSNRVYQLSNDNDYSLNEKVTKRSTSSQFSLIFQDEQLTSQPSSDLNEIASDCEHYLKIGCNVNPNHSLNDYSIFRKCQFNSIRTKFARNKKDIDGADYLTKLFNAKDKDQMPVTESETNRMCLAFWPIYKINDQENDENYVTPYGDYSTDESVTNDQIDVSYIVLTKSTNSDTFSITCSLWESFKNSKKLKITDDNSFKLCEKNLNNQIYSKKKSDHHHHHVVTSQRNIDNQIAAASASPLVLHTNGNKNSFDNSYVFDYKGTCSKHTLANKSNYLSFSNSCLLFILFYLIYLFLV